MMEIVTCVIKNNYYQHCLEILNKLAEEDKKYQFELITNMNSYNSPKLIMWTIADIVDYKLLENIKDEYDIYHTILIIEKLPSTDKEKESIEKLRENKKYFIYYNEPGNQEFYTEDLFKSIFDKLYEDSARLIPYLNVRKFG